MKKKVLLSFFVFLCNSLFAQINLVPNGSFEDTIQCPTSSNQVNDCNFWQPVLNTPDYYHTCAAYPVGVPVNFFGDQLPFQGEAYMGLHTFASFFPDYREIICVGLLDSLMPGFNYHFSMRISRGNWTNDANCIVATNNLGVRLTTFQYTLATPPPINNLSQFFDVNIETDTINWTLLEWDFISDSAYKFLSIGNFFDDSSTDTLNIGAVGQPYGRGGYFIDSINFICTNCLNGIINLDHNINGFEYDFTNSELIITNQSKTTISIINSVGQLVFKKINYGSIRINTKNFGIGIFVVFIDDGEIIKYKKIINYHDQTK